MNQLHDKADERRWRRAVEVAFRVLTAEGSPPCSAAELCACVHPPRVLEAGRNHLTRVRFFELRRALCRRLLFLGWSGAELGRTCRFDHDTVRALVREGRPTDEPEPLPAEVDPCICQSS